MDVYSLSDAELIKEMKRHNIEFGPILASTRRVYQKKLQKVLESGAASSVPLVSRQTETYEQYEEDAEQEPSEPEEEEEPEPEPVPSTRQMRQRITRERPSSRDTVEKPPSPRNAYREEPARPSTRFSRVPVTQEHNVPEPSPVISAADIVTQAREEDGSPTEVAATNKKGGLSIWMQLLIVLIVAFLLFLVFQNMEPAGKAPIRQLDHEV